LLAAGTAADERAIRKPPGFGSGVSVFGVL
jgi:hypothetical protein